MLHLLEYVSPNINFQAGCKFSLESEGNHFSLLLKLLCYYYMKKEYKSFENANVKRNGHCAFMVWALCIHGMKTVGGYGYLE